MRALQRLFLTFLSLTVSITGCNSLDDAGPTGLEEATYPQSFQGSEPVRDMKADQHWGMTESIGEIDGYNEPTRIDPNFETRYVLLPVFGQASSIPWTDTYWPRNKGGISHRWQTDEAHTYVSPTFDELRAMSPEEINKLSPTEKYDIFAGNYDYTLTLRIKSGNKPTEAGWTGYCHGWTMASIHFEEPRPVTLTNADGITVTFGSSDIKALLTYFQGEVVRTTYSKYEMPFKAEITTVGTLCGSSNPIDRGCVDSNPGAFHVVMANMLGKQGKAFGIDADNKYEKWNHPVHKFRSQNLGSFEPSVGASSEAVEELLIVSEVTYTIEIQPQWDMTNGTDKHADKTKAYAYTLELNKDGEIIGGQWVHRLEDGAYMTLTEVYEYFRTLDENGDGNPDVTEDQLKESVWHYFDFPDYVWYQEKGEFSDTFEQPASSYTLMANTKSSRKILYDYFAKLGDIYRAATP